MIHYKKFPFTELKGNYLFREAFQEIPS